MVRALPILLETRFKAVPEHAKKIVALLGKLPADALTEELRQFANAARKVFGEEGGNRIAVYPSGEDVISALAETNRIISQIKEALNMFFLFFQPVVNLGDGKTAHYEALLRLQDREGRLLFPGQILSVAERFGPMPQIDRWIVQAALDLLRAHPIFVNVSGASLGDEALVNSIAENIRKKGIDPARLGFEITETVAVTDLSRAEEWVKKLKALGCPLAPDDFGPGFSSFSYLRTLPVDYLKIDGAFIRDIDKDPAHRALVQAMNTVAHILGKKTIAKFVESESILKTLQELSVGLFSGKTNAVR